MCIYTIDDFFDENDFEYFLDYVQSKNITQEILNEPQIADMFWQKYGEDIRNIPVLNKCIGICPSITVTNSSNPISRHVDTKRHGEQYKILIYLNNVSHGGTIFYPEESDKPILIENKANRFVLFDIDIPHKSQIFFNATKIAIGFRILGEKID